MTAVLTEPAAPDLALALAPELSVAGGLPGFPGAERYLLVSVPEAPPLFRLVSLDVPGLEFVLALPEPFFPDYAPELDDASAARLGLHPSADGTDADALLLVVLTLGDDLAQATANLLAPIVVNARDSRAAQVVVQGDHPLRARLRRD